MKKDKKRMKPGVFIKKYARILIGGFIIAAVLFCAVFAPYLTKWDPEKIDMEMVKIPPNEEHLFGTDVFGRDIFARVIYGSRSTLIVAIGTQLTITVIGTILGLLCGYYKQVEKVLMRILDAFATIPNLLLCLLMISVLGPGLPNLILAMSINGIPGCARMIRNQVLSLREKEYIESEKAMGANDVRTLFHHILPACASYLLVRFSNGLAGSVLSMTSLSYLGLGLDPTIASWGGIVQEGQVLMFVFPHLILYAAIAISITVFGFSLLGDGIRDRLDPRLK